MISKFGVLSTASMMAMLGATPAFAATLQAAPGAGTTAAPDQSALPADQNGQERGDIIVTGIRVPGSCDGVELVRRLRDGEATKGTPVIVLTACAFEPDQQRAFAATQ